VPFDGHGSLSPDTFPARSIPAAEAMGQIRPWCSLTLYGSLSSDSCCPGWMPMTAALGQKQTHALQQSMPDLIGQVLPNFRQ